MGRKVLNTLGPNSRDSRIPDMDYGDRREVGTSSCGGKLSNKENSAGVGRGVSSLTSETLKQIWVTNIQANMDRILRFSQFCDSEVLLLSQHRHVREQVESRCSICKTEGGLPASLYVNFIRTKK